MYGNVGGAGLVKSLTTAPTMTAFCHFLSSLDVVAVKLLYYYCLITHTPLNLECVQH